LSFGFRTPPAVTVAADPISQTLQSQDSKAKKVYQNPAQNWKKIVSIYAWMFSEPAFFGQRAALEINTQSAIYNGTRDELE
jgi:hypothetical protein